MTDQEKWHYIVGSLIGGLDYVGICKWLSVRSDLDTAYEDARQLRGGMVAT